MKKICTKCNTEKLLSDYYTRKSASDGKHSQCKKCSNEYTNKRYHSLKLNDPEKLKKERKSIRNSQLKNTFGITHEQYNQLLDKQNHCCAICGTHESDLNKGLSVDHARVENMFIPKNSIRGLLCNDCNMNLISNRTDPEIFIRASEYVKQYTGIIIPDKENN